MSHCSSPVYISCVRRRPLHWPSRCRVCLHLSSLFQRLLYSLPPFPLSLDNPGGWINDDEWISDDEQRGKDVGLLLLLLLLQDNYLSYERRPACRYTS